MHGYMYVPTTRVLAVQTGPTPRSRDCPGGVSVLLHLSIQDRTSPHILGAYPVYRLHLTHRLTVFILPNGLPVPCTSTAQDIFLRCARNRGRTKCPANTPNRTGGGRTKRPANTPNRGRPKRIANTTNRREDEAPCEYSERLFAREEREREQLLVLFPAPSFANGSARLLRHPCS